MVKTHLSRQKDEMKDYFKGCLTRNSFLRNQGYVDDRQFKIIRERILTDQATILEAFDKVGN